MRLDRTERVAFLAGAVLFLLGCLGALEAWRVGRPFDCRAVLADRHPRDFQGWQARLCVAQLGPGWATLTR